MSQVTVKTLGHVALVAIAGLCLQAQPAAAASPRVTPKAAPEWSGGQSLLPKSEVAVPCQRGRPGGGRAGGGGPRASGAPHSPPPGGGGRTVRSNASANVNHNLNGNRNVNANVNRNYNSNVNVNRNVNVNVDNHYDYHDGWDDHWHPVATAAAVGATVAVTAAVVGSITRTLPPSCSTVIVNGISYSQCGATWYEPRYSGTTVEYVVVNPPR
ncbi:MAG: hypothetical protein J7521_14970 [Caulobacter sp.]|nr:hypothetical protein [Caulobacter sp.]